MRSDHSFFGSLSVKMQRPQRNADYGMDEKTVGASPISPKVWESCKAEESVLSADRKTGMDYWMSYLALYFDINFLETYQIIYQNKKTVLSFEIFPPKKEEELKNIDRTLEALCEVQPDFISVTFGAGGSANKNKTIELAKKIKEDYHIEPVVHLTCLCYDRQEIDEFARQLQAEGIENILALRGDRNPDIPEKEDFKHASDLITYMKEKGDFCVAGACYPEDHPESESHMQELKALKTKVDAGAELLLSQLFFDNHLFYDFASDCKNNGITVPVTPGIMPVTSAAQIQRMVKMCGATLPDSLQKIVERYADNKPAMMEAGIYYAVNQILDLLANDMHGIHLYTMNNPEVAKKICAGIQHLI